MPIRIGIRRKIPFARFMPTTIVTKVNRAIRAFTRFAREKVPFSNLPNASLTPTPVRLRPMMMMTGPVTSGGKNLRMRSGPRK